MKKLLFLFLIFGFSLCEGQSWLWARQAYGTGQEGNAVAADSIGDVFETGYFIHTLIFDTDTDFANYFDIYLVKFDSSGNELWVKTSMAQSNSTLSYVYSVNSDNVGNSYITGYYQDTINFGTFALNSVGNYNLFFVKYDGSGNVVWAKNGVPATIDSYVIGYSGCPDNMGNSYVTGFISDTVSFGAFSLFSSHNGAAFLTKYDINGNVLWAKCATLIGRSSQAIGTSVSIDNIGNSYIAGFFYDTVSFGVYNLYSGRNYNAFLVKYDVNGNVLWAKCPSIASSASGVFAPHISADDKGNTYLTGEFRDTVYFGSYTISSISSTYYNTFLAKYDSNGNIKWAKNAVLKNKHSGSSPYSISSDNFGQVYISGQIYDTVSFGSTTLIEDTSGADGAFLIKYDSSGNVICAFALASGGDDENGVSADRFGNVYFGGDFEPATFVLGNDTLYNKSSSELAFIAKERPCPNTTESIPNLSNGSPSLSLFPNPNKGKFTIAFAGPQNLVPTTVEVYNIMGQKVFSEILRSTQDDNLIDITNQPSGIYLYRVLDESGALVGEGKFVITH